MRTLRQRWFLFIPTLGLWGLWVLLTLAVTGCAFKAPRQDEALALVWHDAMERTEPPPVVDWVFDLTCGPPGGRQDVGYYAQTTKGWGCVGGRDLVGWGIEVAYVADLPFHEMSVAHECNHKALLLEGVRDGDPDHKGPSWQPGGRLAMSNAMLEAIGL